MIELLLHMIIAFAVLALTTFLSILIWLPQEKPAVMNLTRHGGTSEKHLPGDPPQVLREYSQ